MTRTQAARTTVAALALVVGAACGGSEATRSAPPPTADAPSTAAPSTGPPAPPTTAAPAQDGPRVIRPEPGTPTGPASTVAPSPEGSSPDRVAIPRIGVDAPVVDLGLEPDGALEVPTDWDATGWYTGGPVPGARGPAVIAGHVDSTSGPAVFFDLRDLSPGDEIVVTGDDGSQQTFVVDRTERHPKDAFPTRAVYGLTSDPQLRLITCDGAFDDGTGHYVDNLVVFASLR
ncbi:class F sortase [Iamia majanohamensis]|uniref:Class F sortase n=1 Tax=Iamia majanohamensis TaxID=467976 RepID=A0AAF0BUD9_9ACTN|nr:class F sortase [Iamia majanohamensis]WCO65740.1 class F sortase [Iamia majanohamensis]